jgi:hypothetical protein
MSTQNQTVANAGARCPDSIRYVHKICFSLSNDIEAH